ncbi:MAG: endolytic transglycosylase MltG [Halanaerobiaceae bacterium]|jgi:hypothetical protein|nr:endolytic transglycosylase MltG [Halanaerobiaceae bacterium]
MLLENKFFSIIFNNLVFGLGILLIITGIYFLSQPEAEPGVKEKVLLVDNSYFRLEYDRLSTEEREEVIINIPSGSSGLTVINILDEKGLIPAAEFKKYMELFDIERRIKAGTYRFYSDSTAVEILDKILIKRR